MSRLNNIIKKRQTAWPVSAYQKKTVNLQAEVDKLETEVSLWKDKALRATADFENYRKRMVGEQASTAAYANKALLEDLLPVLDNFNMGMMMAENEKGSTIYIGMQMVQKQLNDFLSAQGVEEIPTAVGDAFDHNIHEAVQEEENNELESGTVARIVRKGYNLKGRLLRPVNVVTVK